MQACPNCGETVAAQQQNCSGCGTVIGVADAAVLARPNPFQPMEVGAAGAKAALAVSVDDYAGFWQRFFAVFIDGFIMSLAFVIISALLGLLGIGVTTSLQGGSEQAAGALIAGFIALNIISILVPWLYNALFESSSWQASPGKRLLGIHVCDTDGSRISFLRATGRHWGKLLSCLILLIGYLMQPFTERKQTLHDKMASTLVMRGVMR